MKSLDEMAGEVRKGMADAVADWKTVKEESHGVHLDIWYDDSKPYFTHVPWKGGMAFEGDDMDTVPIVLRPSWILDGDLQSVRITLDDAYLELSERTAKWE